MKEPVWDGDGEEVTGLTCDATKLWGISAQSDSVSETSETLNDSFRR